MSGIRTIITRLKHPFNFNWLTITRSYAIFPPNYINPIFRHEHQKELSKQDIAIIQHTPIKPATSGDTCSEFYDENIRRFINYLMRHGKKEKARSLIEETFMKIKRKQIKHYHEADETEKDTIVLDPKQIFDTAIANCTPMLELLRIYRGGIAYKVPTPISPERARFLTMKWFIQVAKEHDSKTSSFTEMLADELIQASEFTGRVIAKKQELHKQCEANRAYAHYRWMKLGK